MSIKKTGDWTKVGFVIANLAVEMNKARQICLKRWALKAEGLALGHMSKQDLGWVSLNPKTLAAKIRKGHSENILIATSSYFQSITSWVDESQGIAYAGVKKQAKSSDGEVLADIAKTHEYGSDAANIPARPLWQPVFTETMAWLKTSGNNPAQIFMKNIKKYTI